ncbi:MAG: hypothetical protein ABIS36_01175 [Chryseolinea sp.]
MTLTSGVTLYKTIAMQFSEFSRFLAFLTLAIGWCSLNLNAQQQRHRVPPPQEHVKEREKPMPQEGIKYNAHIFPYTITVNSLNPAVFDIAKNTWIQPSPMPEGVSEIKVSYTINNKADTKAGWITATINNIPLLSSGQFPNVIGVIPAGTNFSSEFHAYGLSEGTYQLRLSYKTSGAARVFSPSGQWTTLDSTLAEVTYDYYVPPLLQDADHDLLDDREESRLIEKFSPYFKYSFDLTDEQFRPTDPIWYIQHSKLLDGQYGPVKISNTTLSANSKDLILHENEVGGASSLYSAAHKTNYRLDMDGSFYFGYADNQGHDWPEIIEKGNIGLYAHVTPIPGNEGLIKIEYWQFFAYNRATTGWLAPIGMVFGPQVSQLAGYAGDHAGDWATVQLIVQPIDKAKNNAQDYIVSLFHYHHGNESRTNMGQATDWRPLWGNTKEFKTPSASYDDESTVQLMTDAQGLFVHPIVYIEWGGHEFWPNTHGSQTLSPKHNGDGKYSYQCHNIPNMGELDWPLSDNSRVIMGFNGYWGSFNVANNNPPGPALHKQWQWPSTSKVGSSIPADDFEY